MGGEAQRETEQREAVDEEEEVEREFGLDGVGDHAFSGQRKLLYELGQVVEAACCRVGRGPGGGLGEIRRMKLGEIVRAVQLGPMFLPMLSDRNTMNR